MSDWVEEARERVSRATEGPWEVDETGWGVGAPERRIGSVARNGDAEFIAHARTDLPAALDEITRLRAALDDVKSDKAKFQRALASWQDIAESNQSAYEHAAEGRQAAESALAAVTEGIALLLADLAKAEPKHFSIGLMCVRVKGLATLATPTTTERGEG